MKDLARRIARLEAAGGGSGIVVTVLRYEGESDDEAIAHQFPEGLPPHELVVIIQKFSARDAELGSDR